MSSNKDSNTRLYVLLTLFILIVVFSIYILIFNTARYKSAFEADQACHYEESTLAIESSSYGCDHDIETDQWILYKGDKSKGTAEVIRRFRY